MVFTLEGGGRKCHDGYDHEKGPAQGHDVCSGDQGSGHPRSQYDCFGVTKAREGPGDAGAFLRGRRHSYGTDGFDSGFGGGFSDRRDILFADAVPKLDGHVLGAARGNRQGTAEKVKAKNNDWYSKSVRGVILLRPFLRAA